MHAREQKIDIEIRQSGSDFSRRHIGPNEAETAEMLRALGFENLERDPRFADGTLRRRNKAELIPLIEQVTASELRA